MGALTFQFTATEQINITNMNFDVTNKRIIVTANNTGTTSVTINEAWVNNAKQTSVKDDALNNLPVTIDANKGKVFNITMSSMSQGYAYQVKLISSKGNAFLYTGTAPS
jgi:deoxyribose-phosphate aldolase